MEKVERKCEKCECNDAIQSFQIQALPRYEDGSRLPTKKEKT